MMLSNLNLSSLPECNFEVRYVDSVLLNPCAEYQRLLRMGKVARIAANFSEYIANEPMVSYRDGRYFVFDGQNTIEARKTCNGGRDLPIRCKVFYGAQKLSHYLYEQGVVGRNNKNIPNTSIVRMIKNKGYTGYLINGAVEAECPQLRIIEPELFEQAQELRQPLEPDQQRTDTHLRRWAYGERSPAPV